jgi:putative tryptophan/tyrosine transport system substrate-binding protein
MIKRREFIAGVAGMAAWPLKTHAQQPDRMRRIGVLMAFDETDPDGNGIGRHGRVQPLCLIK